MGLKKSDINCIIDLMRIDSSNFNDVVSKELRDQLIEIHGLS